MSNRNRLTSIMMITPICMDMDLFVFLIVMFFAAAKVFVLLSTGAACFFATCDACAPAHLKRIFLFIFWVRVLSISFVDIIKSCETKSNTLTHTMTYAIVSRYISSKLKLFIRSI